MVFQSTAAFHHLSSYMVHHTKFLASVGLAHARPNNPNRAAKTLNFVGIERDTYTSSVK